MPILAAGQFEFSWSDYSLPGMPIGRFSSVCAHSEIPNSRAIFATIDKKTSSSLLGRLNTLPL